MPFIADTFHLSDRDAKPMRTVRTAQFWMVLRDGSGYTRYRHETYQSARVEAERLARHCPGERFFVLSSEDCVMIDRPPPKPSLLRPRNDGGDEHDFDLEIPF